MIELSRVAEIHSHRGRLLCRVRQRHTIRFPPFTPVDYRFHGRSRNSSSRAALERAADCRGPGLMQNDARQHRRRRDFDRRSSRSRSSIRCPSLTQFTPEAAAGSRSTSLFGSSNETTRETVQSPWQKCFARAPSWGWRITRCCSPGTASRLPSTTAARRFEIPTESIAVWCLCFAISRPAKKPKRSLSSPRS